MVAAASEANRVQKENRPRLRHAGFEVGFIWAALALAIFAGFAIGAHVAFVIGFDFPLGKGFYSFIQAHGHVQLVGWVGLFIVGISLHFLPRLAGVPLARPRRIRWILWSMVTGLVLRTLGHCFLPYLKSSAAYGPVAWSVALAGMLEIFGIGLYVTLLVETSRRAEANGERAALVSVRPFFGMMVAGWAIYSVLNAALLVAMALSKSALMDQGWNRFTIECFLGLVLLPVAFAFSVRMLPLYLRLAAPAWPVRGTAYAYLLALLLELIPTLPPLWQVTPSLSSIVPAVGQLLRGAVILWFVWNLDVLTRRRDPWTVHRKLHPGAARRPTREGVPDYGEFGRFERLVYSAYAWLVVAAFLQMAIGASVLMGKPLPISHDVVRHLYLLGFITLLIFGMSVRMLPGFVHQKRVASARSVDWTFWMGNAALVGRVFPLMVPAGLVGLVPGAIPVLQGAFGLSGIIGLVAVSILAVNLWRTAHGSTGV